MDLQTFWFILVGILFTGYAMLDGFDLGVGILHLFIRGDHNRRVFLNAIGPVWDGNEVWLVTGGGALFAAFPEVYATALSGFYIPFMLLLCALIFRAVAIEFRSKESGKLWRGFWDRAFALGSCLSALTIGVAMGNITWGVPLDHQHEMIVAFGSLLHPYPLFVGITVIALFAMHGNMYLIMKTEGDLQNQVKGWVKYTIPIYVLCFIIFNVATITFIPHLEAAFRERPFILGAIFIVNMLVVFNIPREVHRGNVFRGFLCSCLQMVLLMSLFGISMYPTMIYSWPILENSLTIYNGSSSEKTLRLMMIIALIGVPIVLTYTACVYYIFRGKVVLTDESY